jgi:hypothetical protein
MTIQYVWDAVAAPTRLVIERTPAATAMGRVMMGATGDCR